MAPPPHDRGKNSDNTMIEIKVESRNTERPMNINSRTVGDICNMIGIDIPVILFGYQIHFSYRSSIVNLFVKDGVPIEQYIRREPFPLNDELEVKSITQAGVKEVTIVVMGLDFMVEDEVMMEYIKSFGGVIKSDRVIYSKDKQGPFKGLLNGERRYLVDMSGALCNMGTYHHIGENKVKVIYKGNSRTCGRCHEEQQKCSGRGIARECTSGRISLEHHMERLRVKKERLKNRIVTDSSPKGCERYEAKKSDFVPLRNPGTPHKGASGNVADMEIRPELREHHETVSHETQNHENVSHETQNHETDEIEDIMIDHETVVREGLETVHEEVITDKSEWSTKSIEPESGKNRTSDENFIPGLNLSRKARRNLKRRQKRIALKEQEEEEKKNKEEEKQHKMTEYLIQSESKKVVETLGLAGITDETELEEIWNGKIPAVCSTPKMTSLIGREIQEEYRRNSLSKKRKSSPELDQDKHQKAKPNTPQNPSREQRKTPEEKDHNFDNESPSHEVHQQKLPDSHEEINNEKIQNKEDLIIFGNTEYGDTGYLNTSGNHSYTL